MIRSVNPVNGEVIREYPPHSESEIENCLRESRAGFEAWKRLGFPDRSRYMRQAAVVLRCRKSEYAALIAEEMGKVIREAEAEVEKCALCCEYYVEHAERFLAEEEVKTEARKSFVTFQPMGVILGVMPWNFPFWQVFRFASPTLMAGNTVVVKHASNVSGCALAIASVFREAGFPLGCFSSIRLEGKKMEAVIAHPEINAVSLTGSVEAGRAVAAAAGKALKKTVLELGGSDPYVILADADIQAAAEACAQSRLINAGQSCIAAKRFIVLAPVRKAFEEHLIDCFKKVRAGDPMAPSSAIGPLARVDLRDALHGQVQRSIAKGAALLLGGVVPEGKGAFYPPTVLSGVTPGMPAFDEELFGPVAAVIEARNEDDAFRLANASRFGLGSAIFSSDLASAERFARHAIDAGQTFVNAFVKSDPRLPFGGIKESGYGRELGHFGIREFVNVKTVYIQ